MVSKNILNVNVVVNRYDPTRTTMLRKAFIRDSNRKFKQLAVAVREAVQNKDIFGLSVQVNEKLSTPNNKAFANKTPQEKVDAFIKWINQKYDETILLTTPLFLSNNYVWTNKYAVDAYKRGVQLARSELKKIGKDIPEQKVDSIIAINPHKVMASLVLADAFTGFKTIASSMDANFSRVIMQSFIDGVTPSKMADRLIAIISGSRVGFSDVVNILGRFVPGKLRGQAHVETTITKAHHLASIQEYEIWDIQNVNVQVEFSTMNDNKVCSICASLDGQVFTLGQIRTIIPVHVRCRCFARPIKM